MLATEEPMFDCKPGLFILGAEIPKEYAPSQVGRREQLIEKGASIIVSAIPAAYVARVAKPRLEDLYGVGVGR